MTKQLGPITIQYRDIGGGRVSTWVDWGTCRDPEEAISFIRSAQVSAIVHGGIARDWRHIPTPQGREE